MYSMSSSSEDFAINSLPIRFGLNSGRPWPSAPWQEAQEDFQRVEPVETLGADSTFSFSPQPIAKMIGIEINRGLNI
jgi:hypothetical protein